MANKIKFLEFYAATDIFVYKQNSLRLIRLYNTAMRATDGRSTNEISGTSALVVAYLISQMQSDSNGGWRIDQIESAAELLLAYDKNIRQQTSSMFLFPCLQLKKHCDIWINSCRDV